MADIIGFIVLALVVVAFSAPFVVIGFSIAEYNPIVEFRKHQRQRQERHMPLWERLALAEQRAGEEQLREGNAGKARFHFREAQKIRDNAMQDLTNGEMPKL